jgi:RNA polymerase sigma factor FliA
MIQTLMPKIKQLAYKIWSHGARKSLEVEDLVQAAVMRILKARRRFDAGRSRWSTFALLNAHGAMRDEIRSLDHVPRLERARAKKDGRRVAEVERLVELPQGLVDRQSSQPIQAAGTADFWARIGELLGPRGRRILESYWREGKTLKQIGRDIGLSESRLSQLVRKDQEQLRRLNFCSFGNAR